MVGVENCHFYRAIAPFSSLLSTLAHTRSRRSTLTQAPCTAQQAPCTAPQAPCTAPQVWLCLCVPPVLLDMRYCLIPPTFMFTHTHTHTNARTLCYAPAVSTSLPTGPHLGRSTPSRIAIPALPAHPLANMSSNPPSECLTYPPKHLMLHPACRAVCRAMWVGGSIAPHFACTLH
eukprot:1158981-Pelagomonas_calceolata.AAC.11